MEIQARNLGILSFCIKNSLFKIKLIIYIIRNDNENIMNYEFILQ